MANPLLDVIRKPNIATATPAPTVTAEVSKPANPLLSLIRPPEPKSEWAGPVASVAPQRQFNPLVNIIRQGEGKKSLYDIAAGEEHTKRIEEYKKVKLPDAMQEKLTPPKRGFWRTIAKVMFHGEAAKLGEAFEYHKLLSDPNISEEQKTAFNEQLSDKNMRAAAGTLEMPARFLWGIGRGRTFDAPGLLAEVTNVDIPKPISTGGDIAERVGELAGFMKALKWMGTWKPFKAYASVKPLTWWGAITKRMVDTGFRLGTYSLLSTHGGKSFSDNLKERGIAFGSGAALGAMFGAAGGITEKGVKSVWDFTRLDRIAAIPDAAARWTAFVMRMGVNQWLVAKPAFDQYKKGEESMPGLIYNIGLGWLFSMSGSSPAIEAEFNRAVKRKLGLTKMDLDGLHKALNTYKDKGEIPADLKWAYILKAYNGRIKPSVQNAAATDYMFNETIRLKSPELYQRWKLENDIQHGITEELTKVFEEQQGRTGKQSVYTKETKQIDKEIPKESRKEMIKELENLRRKKERLRIERDEAEEREDWIIHDEISEQLDVLNQQKNTIQQKYTRERSTSTGITKLMHMGKEAGVLHYDVVDGKADIAGIDTDATLKQDTAIAIKLLRRTILNIRDEHKDVTGITSAIDSKNTATLFSKFGAKFYDGETGKELTSEEVTLAFGDKPLAVGDTIEVLEGERAGEIGKVEQIGEKITYKTENGSTIEIDTKDVRNVSGRRPVEATIDFNSTDFDATLKSHNMSPELGIIPQDFVSAENKLRMEMVTNVDIKKLKSLASRVGLIYKSTNGKDMKANYRRFLSEYFNIKEDQLNTLTKGQLQEARSMLTKMRRDPLTGRIKLPRSREILPLDVFKWSKQRGNIYDWLQSARMPLKPIYDLVKPAYIKYINERERQVGVLNKIYGNRVKSNSQIDQLIAMEADGKIEMDEIPEGYRDIVRQRRAFYQAYADRLVEAGLIPRNKVWGRRKSDKVIGTNKKGNPIYEIEDYRKPYYHRIFEKAGNAIENMGYNMEDSWMPGNLPMAGPLKKRVGSRGYKYSALESDMRYIYAIEKYLNLKGANDASRKYATLLTGMRREMAKTYIRGIRGQPTQFDKQIRESLLNTSKHTADIMEKAGLKKGADRLRRWDPGAYPVSNLTSPLARFYYWRFVGLGFDTAFKNALQVTHSIARYHPKYVDKAMYAQYTPEGKRLIAESGIHDEGIRRGGHLVAEDPLTRKMNDFEKASYWMWNYTDVINRNIAGLAAYYKSKDMGNTHTKAMQDMIDGSHETQFGYTKSDSLLADMANPLSRFILFKKWPLAKIEMIRSWLRDGNTTAVFNLALTEYAIYRIGLGLGIDLGPQFSAIWELATRGIEGPTQFVPVIDEAMTIYKAFQPGYEGEKAREKLVAITHGLGNRWVGKVVDTAIAWKNEWKIKDLHGNTKIEITPKEAITGLFFRPIEKSERYQKIQEMRKLGDTINGIKEKIVDLYIAGKPDKAIKLQDKMMEKYQEDYRNEFGKVLTVVGIDDIKSRLRTRDIPMTERIRKSLPGKTLPEAFKGEPTKKTLRELIRGY